MGLPALLVLLSKCILRATSAPLLLPAPPMQASTHPPGGLSAPRCAGGHRPFPEPADCIAAQLPSTWLHPPQPPRLPVPPPASLSQLSHPVLADHQCAPHTCVSGSLCLPPCHPRSCAHASFRQRCPLLPPASPPAPVKVFLTPTSSVQSGARPAWPRLGWAWSPQEHDTACRSHSWSALGTVHAATEAHTTI